MKLILVGRSGSGKTSVMESLMGYSPSEKSPTNTVTRFGLPITIADSLGFFSVHYDQEACRMKLAECVYSFTPGPDAFGLVIRIGRFTAEERKVIDIFRETFGEEVFRFTILIFTQIDDLLYDNRSLDEFLSDSTPEMRNIISLCGGRYTGFSNTEPWESRTGYGQSLVSMIQALQTKNNSVYTVDMLKKATRLKMTKEEKERKRKEEANRQLKEEMKATVRQEVQDQMRKDIQEKLSREEQEQKMMSQTFPELKTHPTSLRQAQASLQKETQPMKQYDQTMSFQFNGQDKKSQKHPIYSSATSHWPRDNVEPTTDENMKLILVGRSGSGKTSVMESLMGSPLTSQNQICTVTRFGQQLTIAETFGFFSRRHDVNTCTKKLAESVYSFQPGPDVFGLLIPIGRYTDEEKKMVQIFREILGEDVFHFTILIFTRLDDLIYDNIPLDNFLENGTTEMKKLLTLCGGRYVGFDNTASTEERIKYSQSLVSMAKTLQLKNNSVYTVAMLKKATMIKLMREEEESKRKEERHRQLKEAMKETMRQELQDQIKKDIEEKLLREEQEHQMKVLTLPQTKPHITVEHSQTPPLKETHQEREESDHNMLMQSTAGKGYNTKEQNRQDTSGLHPDKDYRKRQPKVYSRQQESVSTPENSTEQSQVKGSSQKETRIDKKSNQKPALKPKPSLKGNNKKKKEGLDTQRVVQTSAAAGQTPLPEDRAESPPRRTGFIGRMISFFESLTS